MAKGDKVEPTASAWATGGCAVFVALFTDLVSDFVILFGGEWALADAGGVGFADAEGVVDVAGADSGSKARTASGWVA